MQDRRASCSLPNPGRLNRLRLAFTLATFLLWARPVHAATVTIVWPAIPSAESTQALTLLRGELLSVGLTVTTSDRVVARGMGEANSLAWLETLAAGGAGAVIDVVGDHGLEAIDVWVVKTNPQRFEVTRVAVDPSEPKQPEMLALRAVEALRASLLQLDWAARRQRQEPSAKPATAVVPTSEIPGPGIRPERLSVEAGAVAILNLAGLGPAVLPIVCVGWAARPWLVVHASGAGLGSRSAVTTTEGRARVAQHYAVLGGYYRRRATQRLWPLVGLAAGVLRTSIEGASGVGMSGQRAERWSGLIDVSVGTGLRLAGRTDVTLAAHAQVAEPYVAVHIGDTVGATAGRPNFLLTLTVGTWL